MQGVGVGGEWEKIKDNTNWNIISYKVENVSLSTDLWQKVTSSKDSSKGEEHYQDQSQEEPMPQSLH